MSKAMMEALERIVSQEGIERGKIDRILSRMEEEVSVIDCNSNSSYFKHAFLQDKKLGSGGSGRVYGCRHRFDGLRYAVKKVPICDELYDWSIGEPRKLAVLNHPFVVRYFQAWVEDDYDVSPASSESSSGPDTDGAKQSLYIAMELCPRVLKDEVESMDSFRAWKYFKQLLEGLAYVHGNCLVHGDLKPGNIFIDEDDNVKIGDFGIATRVGEICPLLMSDDVKLNAYRSPESEEHGTPLTPKADIFSLGLIIYELLHCFGTVMERNHTFLKIRTGDFDWDGADAKFMRYAPRMFARDPTERSSACDLLSLDA